MQKRISVYKSGHNWLCVIDVDDENITLMILYLTLPDVSVRMSEVFLKEFEDSAEYQAEIKCMKREAMMNRGFWWNE